MNYRRSRVYTAPVPKMPPGLLELMEGLSKDVLRNNPTNIYEFCADHMEKLLQIRDDKRMYWKVKYSLVSTPKNVLTLEQKITTAQKIIRERAKQRREKYDQTIIQRELESKLVQNVDESPMYMQKNIVIIPDNVISTKQVELVGMDEEICSKDHNKCYDDEYVRNLLFENSSIEGNKHEEDKNIPDEQVVNLEIETHDQDKKIDDTESKKIISDEENKMENVTNCDSVENLIFEKDVRNLNEILKEKSEEIDILKTDDNGIDAVIENNIDTGKNVNSDAHKTSKGLKSDLGTLNPSTSADIGELAVTPMIETKHIEVETECLNQNEGENSSLDSEMLSGRNTDDNVLLNDYNNTNIMDLETAAITIQKVFRSFLFKCKTTSIDESTNVDINLFINDRDVQDDINILNINKDRRGITRMDTVLQTVNEEKSLSLSTDDSSTLSSAATVIQAHIRGFLVRNKLQVNKTLSTSPHDSDAVSGTSLEMDDQQKGKTILNIHIVPEKGNFTSRDESFITSMDLSMDGSPRSLTNLHPHSYDINERRKQLKREDAVQSVSPPSNNSSSKLSEDIDSVRECLVLDTSGNALKTLDGEIVNRSENEKYGVGSEIHTAVENEVFETSPHCSMEKLNADETDVVTPHKEQNSVTSSENKKIMHSSEFHEAILPTQVSRTDTSVVRGE